MNHRRLLFLGAGTVGLGLCLALSTVRAQTPKINLDIDEVTANPGEVVAVSVFIDNLPDTVQAFEISVSLNRPDIMKIRPEIVTAGTLIEGWSEGADQFGDYDVHVIAAAGFGPDRNPILPNTTGLLLKLVAELYCSIPDTLQDRTVQMNLNAINTNFSTPGGTLIVPLNLSPGAVTPGLQCPYQGDIEPDGFITALDLSGIIAALFEGGSNPQDPCCLTVRFDLDCDGFLTSLDLTVIIDYLFSGGAGPCGP